MERFVFENMGILMVGLSGVILSLIGLWALSRRTIWAAFVLPTLSLACILPFIGLAAPTQQEQLAASLHRTKAQLHGQTLGAVLHQAHYEPHRKLAYAILLQQHLGTQWRRWTIHNTRTQFWHITHHSSHASTALIRLDGQLVLGERQTTLPGVFWRVHFSHKGGRWHPIQLTPIGTQPPLLDRFASATVSYRAP